MADSLQHLEPLPYHQEIRAFLQQEEPDVWEWFSTNRVQQQQAEQVRFELLKSTYRLEREASPRLYELGDQALERLELDVPLTLYQAQNVTGLNASLAFVPDQAHIVLHGDLSEILDEAELLALLAHELSHLLLYRRWEGEYLIADQILTALSLDPSAEAAHEETARRNRLYTEIFCDRGSLSVTGDVAPVITTLVKMQTGVREVQADAYLKQANEIFAQQQVRTESLSHPETFIRVWSLQQWMAQTEDWEDKIRSVLEGEPCLESLDLLGQRRVEGLTERIIRALLAPSWIRSEAILNHARSYFEEFDPDQSVEILDRLAAEIATADDRLRDYYCYVLLDFVTADRDLEEYPLAAAIDLAEQLGLLKRFTPLAIRELRLRKRQFDRIAKERESLLLRVEQEGSSP